MSSHSLADLGQIQVIYGVDFGTRNICISKIVLDFSPFSENRFEISYLSDQIGKRTIFNGVQYIGADGTDNANNSEDAMTLYKKRRLGNECARSKPVHQMYMNPASGMFVETPEDIEVRMPDGSNVTIPLEISRASVATHIRELIDNDMEHNKSKNAKVVFAFPSCLSPNDRLVLRWRILQIFNLENDSDEKYELDFITESAAVAFARFNQAYPNYINRDTDTKSSDEKILILNAGHTQTEIMEVQTEYIDLRSKYRVRVLNRLSVPVGGKDLDNAISYMIGKCDSSKDVENIKHNISMFMSTKYDDENGSRTIQRNDVRGDLSMKLQKIEDFIIESNASTIELVGGFCRSFLIQELLESVRDRKNIVIRRGLSADETTALGTAVYEAVKTISIRSRKVVEFDRCVSTKLQVESPWTETIDGIEETGGCYRQDIKFQTCRIDLSNPKNDGLLRMIAARDHALNPKEKESVSDVRMLTIKASQIPNTLIFENIKLKVGIQNIDVYKCPYFTADLFVCLDMLDLPEVVSATKPGVFSEYLHSLNYGETFSERAEHSTSDMEVEASLRYYQKLYVRIGALYNKMEAFYFDRDTYAIKKQSILSEIQRVKGAYAYAQSSVDNLMVDYKKLLDAYEFCRVVAIDPELLQEPEYGPDLEAVVDTRLSREMVDQIIRDEQGLEMLEKMLDSV